MNRRSARAVAAITLVAPLTLTWAARADAPNPPGVYFHVFTGTLAGSEWSTWGDLGSQGRYEFSDLPTDGTYPATVNPDGTFVFDGGVGSGAFHPDGTASMDFQFGAFTHFHSEIRRAPFTDETFPVFLDTPVAGDTTLSGPWAGTICAVDPATGATLDESTGEVFITVFGTTVRIDLPDGSYFQAAWAAVDHAGLRVIAPEPSDPRYRTFPGNSTNTNRNVVGEVRVLGPDDMAATICLQTRAPFGQQVQTMQRLELTRTPAPMCAGDVTGDGQTNSADFNVVASNFGSVVTPDTNGDLTGDGVVNSADFNILAGDFGCGG